MLVNVHITVMIQNCLLFVRPRKNKFDIFFIFYKVAENVLKQNKADKFIYNKDGKPLRFTKQANSQQRREYGEAIFEAKGDSELIREIQEHARELGVLE